MSAAGAGAGAGAGSEKPNRFEAASLADRTREPRRDNRQHHGGNNNSGGGGRSREHGSGGGAGSGRSGVKGVPNDVVDFIVSFHSAVKRGNVFGASR